MPTESERRIHSRRVMTPEGLQDRVIHIQNGVISAVSPFGAEVPIGCVVEDFGDKVIMPGLVDSHVHINEPGRTEWEGFDTATRAAATGGITTLVDMPLNCIPVTTSRDALKTKLASVPGRLWVDCGFYGGVVPWNAMELDPLIEDGVMGFKAFLIHSGIEDFPSVDAEALRAMMPFLQAGGVPLLVHAELEAHDHGMAPENAEPRYYQTYLDSRPGAWEIEAIRMMIRLCEETGCRVHIVHLSCAEALPLLEAARQKGLPITAETCPHYLTFCAEDIEEGDTRFKCAPPIRERANREKLWEALRAGTLDFIVSDHSPCTPELKRLETGDFMTAWGGISSVQFGLSVIWTEARQRGFSLSDLSRWMCGGPAEFLGIQKRKGMIVPGADADLVIWDPEASYTVTPEVVQHRHKLTPYNGMALYGMVHETLLGGHTVFLKGQIQGEPKGKPLFRAATVLQGGLR
jgi:allantoinase